MRRGPAGLLALCGVVAMAATAGSAGGGSGRSWADRWSAEERAVLATLHRSRLPQAPPDPSNRVAGSAAAALLGRQLFADPRLSRNGQVACATCHDPARQFQDGRPRGIGIAEGTRRTMPLADAGHGTWFFWDGRKDSLWSQALGPLEDAGEHGSNRLQLVRLVARYHGSAYAAVFGPLPGLAGLPQHASPLGSAAEQAAWAAMDAPARADVSRAFANLGKAIAAYEATLRHGESRLDRYVQAVLSGPPQALAALGPQEKAGLRLFIGKGRCVTCHSGALLTDQHFHNTGITPHDAGPPARGRAAAVQRVLGDEFNCLGAFSDAGPQQCRELRFIATDDPHMAGAFKTPGLRNVALRPPYMHAGQLATLQDVLRHYAASPPAAVGHSELQPPIRLTAAEQAQIVSLLGALSAPVLDGAAEAAGAAAVQLPASEEVPQQDLPDALLR